MDPVTWGGGMVEIIKTYGAVGCLMVCAIILLWMVWRMADNYRKDMMTSLSEHRSQMDEVRKMYENNVSLARNYEAIAGDMHNLIVMNTQTLQQLSDEVRQNQYCPYVRLEKRSKGMQA